MQASPVRQNPCCGGEPTTGSTLAAIRLLLSPRLNAAAHSMRKRLASNRLQVGGLVTLALGTCALLFTVSYKTLGKLLGLPEVGAFLAVKLLSMVLLGISSLLVFSSLIVALSNFFLSPDLERLVAAPISLTRLLYARLIETIFDSAWMVLLFALPLLCAFGAAHAAWLPYYASLIFVLPAFVLIPVTAGALLTSVLVRIFPARRAHDVLLLLMILGGAVLYVSMRLLQPERLLNPEGFGSFVEFVRGVQVPAGAFLPSEWATNILSEPQGVERQFFSLVLLWSTAAAFLVCFEWVVVRLFPIGFAKALEGRSGYASKRSIIDVCMRYLPLAPAMRLLIGRELKGFFRDTKQWSQLVLLGALIVVYVYNFRVLPSVASPVLTFYLKNLIAFANLALAGFVIASIAARFVLPSVSLEGQSFWITRTAPVTARQVWWSKFLVGMAPLLVVAETLVVLTNSYLGVSASLRWLSVVTIACLTPGIVALALAIGCAQPRFEVGDPAKIAGGVPGLIFMSLAAAYVLLITSLEAWPSYLLFLIHIQDRAMTTGEATMLMATLGTATAVVLLVPALAVRYGVRKLEAIEA